MRRSLEIPMRKTNITLNVFIYVYLFIACYATNIFTQWLFVRSEQSRNCVAWEVFVYGECKTLDWALLLITDRKVDDGNGGCGGLTRQIYWQYGIVSCCMQYLLCSCKISNLFHCSMGNLHIARFDSDDDVQSNHWQLTNNILFTPRTDENTTALETLMYFAKGRKGLSHNGWRLFTPHTFLPKK